MTIAAFRDAIAATSPASHIAVPAAIQRVLESRWHDWEGDCVLWLQLRGWHTHSRLEALRHSHRDHLLSLLQRLRPLATREAMSQIRSLSLDDPRVHRSVLDARLAAYTRRSNDRATTPPATRRIP